jgi:hypothetical protein
MTSLVQSLLGRRTGSVGAQPSPPPAEPDGELDREARIARQIRFLREQELRRARTSIPPPPR